MVATGAEEWQDRSRERVVPTDETALRITSKGQVTIPIEIREKLGLLPNTEVEFSVRGNNAIIKRAANSPRGQNALRTMRGRATKSLSTDDIWH